MEPFLWFTGVLLNSFYWYIFCALLDCSVCLFISLFVCLFFVYLFIYVYLLIYVLLAFSLLFTFLGCHC